MSEEDENIQAFREWTADCLASASDRDLGRIFGTDSFDPERSLDTTRRQLDMLLRGEHDRLSPSLARSMGEDEAHEIAMKLRDQMHKCNQTLDEIADIYCRVAQGRDIPRVSLENAIDTLERQLKRPLRIKPSRRSDALELVMIMREALKDYPDTLPEA